MKTPVIVDANAVGALSEFTDMPKELDRPTARTRIGSITGIDNDRTLVGIWECEPGVFRRQVSKQEFCHFTHGHCFFTPEGEPTLEIRAGDSVYFPANCNGIWDVRERLRKTYFIVE